MTTNAFVYSRDKYVNNNTL